MRLSPLRCFSTGCIFLCIVSVAHLGGHLLPIPLENPTEIKLMTLMNTYPKKIAGGEMTLMDIQNGLSLCYSVFFLFSGIISFILFKRDPVQWQLLKTISLVNALTFGIVMIISVVYFFWIPVISCLAVVTCFTLARLNF